jgi:hypothetical protein
MCATTLDIRPDRRVGEIGASAEACAAKACYGLGCPRLDADSADLALDRSETEAIRVPIAISDTLVADILKPYRPNAKYLKTARITHFRDKQADSEAEGKGLVTAVGQFSIPESCYIDDTGHFNAVEFNICYNQLAYVMFGKCIEAGILHRLRCEKVDVLSFSEFKRQQLPSMVIVSIESRYYKQLDSKDFQGELTLDKISSVGSAWFFFTTMTFSDAQGVKAKGSVVLAFSPNFTPVKH